MTAKGKKAVLQPGDAGFDVSVAPPDGRIIVLRGVCRPEVEVSEEVW